MATKQARTKAILTALADAEPEQAKQDRILNAFSVSYAANDAPTMTTAEKYAVFLRAVRGFVRDTTYSAELRDAQEQARLSIQLPDLGTD